MRNRELPRGFAADCPMWPGSMDMFAVLFAELPLFALLNKNLTSACILQSLLPFRALTYFFFFLPSRLVRYHCSLFLDSGFFPSPPPPSS